MKSLSLILICLLILSLVSLFSIGIGRYPVSPGDLFSWLSTGHCSDGNLPVILFNIRLP